MEPDTKLLEQLEVVAEDIPNLVEARMDIVFYDQSVGSYIEIIEHLIMDDPVAIGGELCVVEHLFVSNEIASVVSLACVDGDLYITADVEFIVPRVDSLVIDVDEGLMMKLYV